MARFIELYSRHRNRSMFPLPSAFDVPFLYIGSRNQDPVLAGAIYYTWTSDVETRLHPLKSGTTNSSPKLGISNQNPLPYLPAYYNGYVMMVLTSHSEPAFRMVTDYNPQDVGVTLDTAFSFPYPHQLTEGDQYLLTEINSPFLIHLPAIDQNQNVAMSEAQAYNGYYVMDETLSYGTNIVARRIEEYDSLLRYCHLESEFPVGWAYTDSYTLRRTLPDEKWTVAASHSDGNYVLITLPPASMSTADRGKWVYWIREAEVGDRNQFKPIYGIYQIVDYDRSTREVRCLLSQIKEYPTAGDTINIVEFLGDNSAPLSYMGSIVSQNQSVCYEVGLISLTLPNLTLVTGSRIAFYPYVYVEFTNSTSASSRQPIYSNNPSSIRALFIVSITDLVEPDRGRFVKLLGKMRQFVTFKPNDSMRFSVFLPDGQPFRTIRQDCFSPYEPDDSLQIDAVFSIRRIA